MKNIIEINNYKKGLSIGLVWVLVSIALILLFFILILVSGIISAISIFTK